MEPTEVGLPEKFHRFLQRAGMIWKHLGHPECDHSHGVEWFAFSYFSSSFSLSAEKRTIQVRFSHEGAA